MADDKPAPAPAPRPTAAKADDKPAAKSDDKPASSGTAYLNASGGPMVYDRAGHTVGAGEWTPEINLDKIGQAARSAGHLLPKSAL